MNSGVARICCEAGQSWKVGSEALMANFRAGCSSCSMTNSDKCSTDRKSCELLTSASADLADYTIFALVALSDLLLSELKIKLLKVEGTLL